MRIYKWACKAFGVEVCRLHTYEQSSLLGGVCLRMVSVDREHMTRCRVSDKKHMMPFKVPRHELIYTPQ